MLQEQISGDAHKIKEPGQVGQPESQRVDLDKLTFGDVVEAQLGKFMEVDGLPQELVNSLVGKVRVLTNNLAFRLAERDDAKGKLLKDFAEAIERGEDPVEMLKINKDVRGMLIGNVLEGSEVALLFGEITETNELRGGVLAEMAGTGVDIQGEQGVDEFADEQYDSEPAGVGDIDVTEDPVALYFRQMGTEPLLDAEEEIILAKRIEAGNEAQEALDSNNNQRKSEKAELEATVADAQAARARMGRANTRLVISIAKRYMGRGLPFPDLIQEGNVGLMRAVAKYDYKRGNRFSTYATWWIRQKIKRALSQKTRTVRIPVQMNERIRLMYKRANELTQELGRRPTAEEIAERMDLRTEKVAQMLDDSRDIYSLDRPVGDAEESELFGDFIKDKSSEEPFDQAVKGQLQADIEDLLEELTPRQAMILRMRFGLGKNQGAKMTLEQIAVKFGLSRERIRQLEKQALRQLRNPRLAHNLRDYLDHLDGK